MSEIQQYLETKPNLTRAVVGYLVMGDEVILGLRKKVSFGLGENLISGIGGKVGDSEEIKDETDDQAMIRETEEEIGVRITNMDRAGKVIFLFPNKPKWSSEVTIYVIRSWEGDLIETDAIKPTTHNVSELPKDRMWDDNQYWVPLVLAGKNIEAVFLYEENNTKVKEYTIKEIT